MATFNKFNIFAEDLATGVHDFTSTTGDQISVVLCDVAPVATDAVLADLTATKEIETGGGYTKGTGVTLDGLTLSNSSGVVTVTFTDEVITATGAAINTFRYIAFYNDGTTAKTNPLIGWYDYGSNVDLADGESFTIDFQTNGLFRLGEGTIT